MSNLSPRERGKRLETLSELAIHPGLRRGGEGTTPASLLKFGRVVKKSFLQALGTLGNGPRNLILKYIQAQKEVCADDIPGHLKEVDDALDQLFGDSAGIIKTVTLHRVCSALRLEPPKFARSLEEAIASIKLASLDYGLN